LRTFGGVAFAAALACQAVCAPAAHAAGATTTLGTRGSLAQPNPPIFIQDRDAWQDYTRAEDFEGSVTLPLQFITTRSGKKLAVLVSVPANAAGEPVPGRFPAVLTQTAYRIDVGQLLGFAVPNGNTLLVGGKDEFMIRRGYISVAVDVLGSGMSQGQEALLGADEQAAYADAVAWVTRQPWFDGNLGLAGTSYLGITSLLTAGQQPPAVKAVFAEVPMGDAYRGTVGIGGLLNAEFISVWLPLTQNLSVANAPAKLAHPEFADQIEAANQEHVQAINDWYLPTVTRSLGNVTGYASDDGDFWAVRSPIEVAARIKAPTFLIGAANDIFQRDEPLLYEQLKRRVNTKLVILPGAHVQSVLASQFSNRNALAQGTPPAKNLMLQWFDHYLKGVANDAERLPTVTQHVQGWGTLGKRFATAADWPHPQARAQRYYLHGNGVLNTTAPTATEATRSVKEPPAPEITFGASASGQTVHGKVTVNDGSGCSSSMVQWSLGIAGVLPLPCHSNNATVERAQGAAIYQTAPLAADLYLNGPIQADVWVSTTRSEAALAVRVDDVDPLGRAVPISTGLQSVAFRAVDTSRSRYMNGEMIQPWHPYTVASRLPVVPGQPMWVPVEVFPAAALIKAGHRLRIAISASNQAMGVWPTPLQALADGNVTTLHHDPLRPSSVVLPLVPTSALAP
jgi:putative CocE/NonD family hydrolase